MDRTEAHTLTLELCQFTDSNLEIYYRHSRYRKYTYTEGVKYLAEKAQAYWLLDLVFESQSTHELQTIDVQIWNIRVLKDRSVEIKGETKKGYDLVHFRLYDKDFPLAEFDLWLVENTLLLPSEI